MDETLVVEGVPVGTVDAPPAPGSTPVPEVVVEAQTQPDTPLEPPYEPPPTAVDTAGPQEPQEAPLGPAPILETAFIVYMNPQGHWMVASDLHQAAEMQISRPPNVDDYFYGCSMVIKDIHVQETSQLTAAFQQDALMKMAEKARQDAVNQQISQALGGKNQGGIDLSKLGR